jgi:tetratricopeptide (TPR) repeat protein
MAAALGCLLVLLLVAAGLGLSHLQERRDAANQDWRMGVEQIASGKYREAEFTLTRGLERIKGLPGNGALKRALADRIRRARRSRKVSELRVLAQTLRLEALCDSPRSRRAVVLATGSQAVWSQRHVLASSSEPLDVSTEQGVRDDLLDLVLLWSELRVRQAAVLGVAGRPERAEAVRQAHWAAQRCLVEAEEILGPRLVLARAQEEHARQAGLRDEARRAHGRVASLRPLTLAEQCAWARALLGSGDLAGASREFAQLCRQHPHAFWPNVYLGICLHRQGHQEEAVKAFSTCITQSSSGRQARAVAELYLFRALAQAALGKEQEALQDLGQAERLRPDLAATFLHRGILHARANRPVEALRDLAQALRFGADPASVHCWTARAQLAQGQPKRARASLREALRHDPGRREAVDLLQSVASRQ